MRNLKRVFSLALACIMVIGMMVMTTGAAEEKITFADFTDKDSITNVEAVSLLNDLGIIEGYPDESYRPTATIDRASMAKLICKIMMGDVPASTFEGTQTDLTDIEGHWAEGYIKYCYSTGVIAGNGDGTFLPNNPVTVVEAAKMLLVALGYDAETQGYVNNGNWSVNIMKDAATTKEAGSVRALTEGLSVSAAAPLTRDNAAQMILNTLFVDTVSPVYQWDMGTQHINGYTSGLSLEETMYSDITRHVGVLTDVDADGYVTVAGAAPIAAANKITGSVEEMGKAVVYYKDGANFVSTSVAADTTNSAVTVPGNLEDNAAKPTDVNKWLKKNGLQLSGSTTDYTVTDYVAATGTAIVVGDLCGIGNYTVAYVIDADDDNVIDTLVKTTKTVSTVTGDVKTKTDAQGNVTVYVPGVTAGYVKAVGYENLAKFDMVMHITFAGTTYITECETVTGKITGYSTDADEIYLDGTAYAHSDGAYNSQTVAQMYALDTTAKKDVKLFLDENGNVLFAKLVSAATSYNVAVVLGYDITSSSVNDSIAGTARMLMADGTIQTVNVASFKKNDTTTDQPAITGANTLKASAEVIGTNYIPVVYSINPQGNYVLTGMESDNATVSANNKTYKAWVVADDEFKRNVAAFSEDDAANLIGNDATVFAVAEYDRTTSKLASVEVTTGIANTPVYDDAGVGADGVIITVDGVAALVFVTSGDQVNTAVESYYIYIPSRGVDEVYDSNAKTYSYAGGYLNGEKTTLVSEVSLTKGAIKKVTVDADGIILSEAAHGGTANVGIEYADGVLTTNTKTGETKAYWTLSANARIFEIEDNAVVEISADGITKDQTDAIVVIEDSKPTTTNVVDFVYITKTETNDNGFSLKAYYVGSNGTKTYFDTAKVLAEGTSAISDNISTSWTLTIAAATCKNVGLEVTAKDDGAIVTVSAEQALVAADNSYDFTVTATAEDGSEQTGTITVNMTSVTAS